MISPRNLIRREKGLGDGVSPIRHPPSLTSFPPARGKGESGSRQGVPGTYSPQDSVFAIESMPNQASGQTEKGGLILGVEQPSRRYHEGESSGADGW